MFIQIFNNKKLQKELYQPDIMSITAPCQGRSKLRLENEDESQHAEAYADDDLFFLQLLLVDILKPRRVISEMTPPNEKFHTDHYAICRALEEQN